MLKAQLPFVIVLKDIYRSFDRLRTRQRQKFVLERFSYREYCEICSPYEKVLLGARTRRLNKLFGTTFRTFMIAVAGGLMPWIFGSLPSLFAPRESLDRYVVTCEGSICSAMLEKIVHAESDKSDSERFHFAAIDERLKEKAVTTEPLAANNRVIATRVTNNLLQKASMLDTQGIDSPQLRKYPERVASGSARLGSGNRSWDMWNIAVSRSNGHYEEFLKLAGGSKPSDSLGEMRGVSYPGEQRGWNGLDTSDGAHGIIPAGSLGTAIASDPSTKKGEKGKRKEPQYIAQ